MQINRRKFTVLGTLFTVMGIGRPSSAAGLANPVESPILVVVGKITATNKGGRAVLDRPMLEGMGSHEFMTSTPWYTGQMQFQGVLFSKLMNELGATGESLIITALDDYSREISIEDLVKNGAILAWKRNGEYLPVSDKGPLFVVYPYDSKPELKNEKYYSRSVWQVRRIEVR